MVGARLLVALTNLAINAVRHAPDGTTVTLRARGAPGVVRFEVDDAGPGVPMSERERIFEPFVRGQGEERAASLTSASHARFASTESRSTQSAERASARSWEPPSRPVGPSKR